MNSPYFFRAARFGAVLLLASHSIAAALDLTFPTKNRALLKSDGEGFYMFIDRDFQGEKSTPWEGGQYGFVRDPRVTSGGLVYRRFHEGADIKPLERSSDGEPLDIVTAAGAGRVVHASNVPGYSNYGRFVVIEHQWDGCPYYSLYALSLIHISEPTRLLSISYAVFCLKKK